MDVQDKTILITGATGFIGGHLARRLQTQEDARVRALVRSPQKAAPLADLGIEIVPGDITDPDAVREATRGADIVYHAAAWADEQGDRDAVWAVNVGGTQHMVDAAVAEGVARFIHLSSCAVYGSLQQMDIDETTPTRMSGRVYHDSKVAAEEVVFAAYRDHGLPVVVVRPSQVYGPGSPQFTVRVIEAVKAGKIILVDGGKHFFKPIYIDNLIDALVLCATVDDAVGEAMNITDGYVVTWREFFEAYGRMAGVTSFPSAPYPAAYVYAIFKEMMSKITGKRSSINREVVKTFHSHNSFSNAKARRILGWEPAVDFEEGMRRTEAWLRENGYLD
ncbi:MAG TPA: NAD-dependent epimerase/dehydratase family protein [Anaerolineae bacterium]|nr:NAD-dependent epimerase/dehydratase family protein [Anaerolineae bacterium]